MTSVGPRTTRDRLTRPLIIYLLLTYGTSWLLWLPALLGVSEPAFDLLVVAGAFGSTVAAGLIVWWAGGSVRGWLRPLLRWRVPARFWLFAVGSPVAVALSIDGVLAGLGEPVHLDRLGQGTLSWLTWIVLGTPLAALEEELGWRGFALDRLQGRHSPLRATLLLGLMWGPWHLPLPGHDILTPMLIAVPLTWLWNRTGSLLLCAILHAAGAKSLNYLVLADLHGPAAYPTIIGAMLAADIALIMLTGDRLGFDHRSQPVTERLADIGRTGH